MSDYTASQLIAVERSRALEQQIKERAEHLGGSPDFSDDLWLTFYVSGQPERLAALADKLAEAGWVNVGGSDSGFIYPKKAVRNNSQAMVQLAFLTEELCLHHGVEILTVDADTSPDVEQSKFVTLFQA